MNLEDILALFNGTFHNKEYQDAWNKAQKSYLNGIPDAVELNDLIEKTYKSYEVPVYVKLIENMAKVLSIKEYVMTNKGAEKRSIQEIEQDVNEALKKLRVDLSSESVFKPMSDNKMDMMEILLKFLNNEVSVTELNELLNAYQREMIELEKHEKLVEESNGSCCIHRFEDMEKGQLISIIKSQRLGISVLEQKLEEARADQTCQTLSDGTNLNDVNELKNKVTKLTISENNMNFLNEKIKCRNSQLNQEVNRLNKRVGDLTNSLDYLRTEKSNYKNAHEEVVQILGDKCDVVDEMSKTIRYLKAELQSVETLQHKITGEIKVFIDAVEKIR